MSPRDPRTMMESGIAWIGPMPGHWRVCQFKHCGTIPNGQVDPRLPAYKGMRLVAPNHIESGTGRIAEPTTAEEQGADSGKYQFEKGVVLYSKIRPELAKAAFATFDGLCSADMYPIRPARDMSAKYLAYLLISPPFTEYVVLESARVAMPKVNREELGSCRVPAPTLGEQNAIADFLDRRTVQIDGVIAQKQRMIDLLYEKRQALISKAITRGLDPNAATNDTGVEWLGRVPGHWSVERLKWRMRKIEQGWSPQCENRQADPGEWGVLKVGCMNSASYDESENKALPADLEPLPEFEVKVGDILMSRSNTVELVGSVGRVHRTQGKILLCDKLYRLVFDESRLDPDFAVLLLRSHPSRLQIERDASGASPSMKNISNEVVADLLLAFPPLDEQRRIVWHVTRRLDELRRLAAVVETQIAKLREYRWTLISAAVTGQIDVTTGGRR